MRLKDSYLHMKSFKSAVTKIKTFKFQTFSSSDFKKYFTTLINDIGITQK